MLKNYLPKNSNGYFTVNSRFTVNSGNGFLLTFKPTNVYYYKYTVGFDMEELIIFSDSFMYQFHDLANESKSLHEQGVATFFRFAKNLILNNIKWAVPENQDDVKCSYKLVVNCDNIVNITPFIYTYDYSEQDEHLEHLTNNQYLTFVNQEDKYIHLPLNIIPFVIFSDDSEIENLSNFGENHCLKFDERNKDEIITDFHNAFRPTMKKEEFTVEKSNIYLKKVSDYIRKMRRKATGVSNDMLANDGAIFYMNGSAGTDFDWHVNGHLCSFIIKYKSGKTFMNIQITNDNHIHGTINIVDEKPYTINLPTRTFEDAEGFKDWLMSNCDQKNLYDQQIL